MTKTIHLIILGDKPTFSNLEEQCIRSWKHVYPDWEIKVWKDAECINWINESRFASFHYYNTRILAYVSDYLRCRILYECGGMYMDIDVFCVNRIPDSYFEKAFLPWDVWGVTTNNGTCMYAPEAKLPVFKEMYEAMSNSDTDVKVTFGSQAANGRVNSVLEKRGLKFEGEYCEIDYDLGDIMVYNRSQFGARHGDNDGYVTHGKEIYMVHMCSGSWVVPSFHIFVNVKYAVIDEKTDINLLKEKLRKYTSPRKSNDVIILFLTFPFECDEEIIEIAKKCDNFVRTYCLPIGFDYRAALLDYVSHRIADIHGCVDIMRERNV